MTTRPESCDNLNVCSKSSTTSSGSSERKAEVDAKWIRTLAGYATENQPTRKGTTIADGAPEEMALRLNMSPNKAAAEIIFARDVMERLPRTLDALAEGVFDLSRVKAMRDYTEPLDPDQASEVEKRVLDNGPRDNVTKFKRGLAARSSVWTRRGRSSGASSPRANGTS
ncbi:DUF222 domain-containing protein [Kibdelosporangium philippinense]|uniref:DUF222 domain-containing protein n=1 Tax=Kibdelosporangium philippinense TaxID=211113 RepID=UPI0027DF0C4C|nr:DUF222 domain-containing protein [Kibdelosporangium philippinense]